MFNETLSAYSRLDSFRPPPISSGKYPAWDGVKFFFMQTNTCCQVTLCDCSFRLFIVVYLTPKKKYLVYFNYSSAHSIIFN